jgi:hypothetical protein
MAAHLLIPQFLSTRNLADPSQRVGGWAEGAVSSTGMRREPLPWECNTLTAVLTAVVLVLSGVIVSMTLGEAPLLQHASAWSRPFGGPIAETEAETAVEVSMTDTGMGTALGMAERAETAADIAISQQAEPAPPPPNVESGRCPPGCSKRGTCNEELGRCECPLGWKGPSCDDVGIPLLSSRSLLLAATFASPVRALNSPH